jgi:hypothetical protein
MKHKKESTTITVRNKYTDRSKSRHWNAPDKNGIPKVAQDLGLAESLVYSWRAKRRQTGRLFEDQKLQQAEMARLKRENATWPTAPADGLVILWSGRPVQSKPSTLTQERFAPFRSKTLRSGADVFCGYAQVQQNWFNSA